MRNEQLEKAVHILGGATKTSHVLDVSVGAIHQWRARGRVLRPRYALRLSRLTGVSLEGLLGDGGEPDSPAVAMHRPEPMVSPTPRVPQGNGSAARRGTRLPDDFTLTEELAAFCRTQGCRNPQALFEHFQDHWRAVAGQRGVKLDWVATLKNWARRHLACPCEKPGGGPPKTRYLDRQEMERRWGRTE